MHIRWTPHNLFSVCALRTQIPAAHVFIDLINHAFAPCSRRGFGGGARQRLGGRDGGGGVGGGGKIESESESERERARERKSARARDRGRASERERARESERERCIARARGRASISPARPEAPGLRRRITGAPRP